MNKEPQLLSRDQFRETVFARDNYTCVFCSAPAIDAHHILERRLWPDFGYYVENGASVCETHHLECEMTTISVEDVRHACGITRIIVPPHLYADQPYDKWGNPILSNGQRVRGELFEDESVQKILGMGGVLDTFTHWVKYPRTYHLPWSPGVTKDDRVFSDCSIFEGKRVIVTEKMDGENTTMYSDHIHARSVESKGHPSRDWVKGFWGQRMGSIPQYWRIAGENMFAKHSIFYDNLPSYFLGFSIWNDHNICLSWDETLEWFELLDIVSVPVLYDGIFTPEIKKLYNESKDWGVREGYVVRLADSFHYKDFNKSLAKYVRKNHIQTTQHWMHGQPIVPNQLKE